MLVVQVGRAAIDDKLTIVAGGVAFFEALAVFPALIAVVSLYGLWFDPADVLAQVQRIGPALPGNVRGVVVEQLSSLVQGPRSQLSLSLAASVAVVVFSASSGLHALVDAVNHAYDFEDSRSWFAVRWLALKMTIGAVVVVVVSMATIAFTTPIAASLGITDEMAFVMDVSIWPVLAAMVTIGLAVLYRYAPDRSPPPWSDVLWGAAFGTLAWLAASYGFSVYSRNVGSFGAVTGTLSSAFAFLLWLYLSAIAILLGAELNSELKRRTEGARPLPEGAGAPPSRSARRGEPAVTALGRSATPATSK